MTREPVWLRRFAPALAAALAFALVSGLVAALWYGSVSRQEESSMEARSRKVARLLLVRVERQGGDDLRQLVDDFARSLQMQVVAIDGEEVVSSPQRAEVEARMPALQAGRPLEVVRQQTSVAGDDYTVYGGTAGPGLYAYVLVPDATTGDTTSAVRPVVFWGWLGTVLLTAIVAFLAGRSHARAISAARERERRMTADIAHEIKNPLGSIVASASMLGPRIDDLPEAVRRSTEVLVREVERLRVLVEDLLELARLESGDHDLHVEVLDLASLVRGVVAARGWTERVTLDLDDHVPVSVDRMSMNRIVLNLTENALHYGRDSVVVRVTRDRGSAVLEVSDAGPGIAAEDLAHVFDRHFTSDPDRPHGGLGLLIAKQNAELLGAGLRVRSAPGEGTTFAMRLPLEAPIDTE